VMNEEEVGKRDHRLIWLLYPQAGMLPRRHALKQPIPVDN
jgi:hypothetical protein